MKTTKKKNTPLKLTSFDELENKHYGKRGSPKREAYETAFKDELIGELIKQIREKQNLNNSKQMQSASHPATTMAR